jgi:futalosine hydrolase
MAPVTETGTGFVCAATLMELEAFGLQGAEVLEAGRLYRIPEGVAAVTGVGMPMTLLRLVPWVEAFRPAWIAVTGIAGAYAGSGLEIADIVAGETEVFADLGMETREEEGEGFMPLADFPFADEAHRSPLALRVPAWAAALRRGRGATVNRCAGSDATGRLRRARFGADFETMEGAAVALAARAPGIPVLEIRAISNFAARRDMRPENVRAALDALRAFWAGHRRHLASLA